MNVELLRQVIAWSNCRARSYEARGKRGGHQMGVGTLSLLPSPPHRIHLFPFLLLLRLLAGSEGRLFYLKKEKNCIPLWRWRPFSKAFPLISSSFRDDMITIFLRPLYSAPSLRSTAEIPPSDLIYLTNVYHRPRHWQVTPLMRTKSQSIGRRSGLASAHSHPGSRSKRA